MGLYEVWVKREANGWDHRGREAAAGKGDTPRSPKNRMWEILLHSELGSESLQGKVIAQPVWMQTSWRRKGNLHAQRISLSEKDDRKKKGRVSCSWAHCFALGIPKPQAENRTVLSKGQGCCSRDCQGYTGRCQDAVLTATISINMVINNYCLSLSLVPPSKIDIYSIPKIVDCLRGVFVTANKENWTKVMLLDMLSV